MSGPLQVRALLRTAFPTARIEISAIDGQDNHLEACVEAAEFEGRSLVERHRMVYAALGSAFDGPLHALALRTLTPTEAATKRS